MVLVSLAALSCGGGKSVQSGSGGAVGSGGGGATGLAGAGGKVGATGGEGGRSATGATAGAAGGSSGVGGRSPAPPALTLDGSPIYTRVQRLTVAQWGRAVADILRVAPATPLTQSFKQAPLGKAQFTNNERFLEVDLQAEVDFEAGSEAAAALATGSANALARLYAGTDPAGFVRAVGRRAFRRPLTADEEARYQTVFALGERLYGTGFANGAALVVRAMLQSPSFLYRSELGASSQPLDGYEVASKLSFWLLGTTPDDQLLDDASAGKLDSADGLDRVARAMLETPAAGAVMRDFHGQLYHLDRDSGLDPARVPADVRAELSETSYRFFDAAFAQNEGVRAILTSSRYFVGPALASSYGVSPAPASIEERVLDSSRVGYFMQIPFLTATNDGVQVDTIRRGLTLNRDVLCVDLASHTSPPSSLPSLMPGETNRQRLERVTASCGGCHTDYLDPLGFALEGFDGAGHARTTDNGGPVVTSSSYPFVVGPRSFLDGRSLMQIMADDPQVHACYAKNLLSYALERDLVEADRPLLSQLPGPARDRSLKAMIVELVRSPTFRVRAEGTP